MLFTVFLLLPCVHLNNSFIRTITKEIFKFIIGSKIQFHLFGIIVRKFTIILVQNCETNLWYMIM